MMKTASKIISVTRRSPAVTFLSRPTGLWIQVRMPRDEANAIAEKAAIKPRAKAKASRAVLSALLNLKDEEKRNRSGFLQANIPSELKTRLVEVAKANGTSITELISDRLSLWIDANTGKRRVRRTKDGLPSLAGPGNYRGYVYSTRAMYSEALTERSLTRVQAEVGYNVVRRIEHLLHQYRVSKSRFMTAVAAEILKKLAGPIPPES
jgi:hypothetical protein